jgi:hypothetical protein
MVVFLGVMKRDLMGPFPAESLNESLGFAIGSGRVGPDADVLDAYGLASLGKPAREVSRTVIRHDLPALHAVTGDPSHSTALRADGRRLLLVSEHLHVGEARRVINGHVDTVVADADRAALLAVARDPMADFAEAGQLLDVDMDQDPGMLPLVALDWRSLLRRSASAWARDSATAPAKGDLAPWPRWRRMRPAAWRCAGGGGAADGDPRPSAVAADRASAAGCGEHSVDPPVQLPDLSGSGPTTYRHS